jgi:hypothetical protein
MERMNQVLVDAAGILAETIGSAAVVIREAVVRMGETIVSPRPRFPRRKVTFRPSPHLARVQPFRFGPAYHRRIMSRRKR